MLPGEDVIVQLPAGRFVNSTLPVFSEQDGCTTVPMTGLLGVTGCGSIMTEPEDGEIQPRSSVTVKVYVPDGRSVKL